MGKRGMGGWYRKFTRAPETFDDTHVIDGHGCEEELGGIGIACLSPKVNQNGVVRGGGGFDSHWTLTTDLPYQ